VVGPAAAAAREEVQMQGALVTYFSHLHCPVLMRVDSCCPQWLAAAQGCQDLIAAMKRLVTCGVGYYVACVLRRLKSASRWEHCSLWLKLGGRWTVALLYWCHKKRVSCYVHLSQAPEWFDMRLVG
jgi:hypothetical protein